MKSLQPIRIIFYLAAAYEGLLGLLFTFAAPVVFEIAGVTPPNHWGYVHFAASMLAIFALIFLQVSKDPIQHKSLILYGILLKAFYIGVVFWHELHAGVPAIWKLFAAFDAIFLVLFIWSIWQIRRVEKDKIGA
jgi:hypothetical protein